MTELDGIRVVPKPTVDRLNERQLVDYRAQREEYLSWLLTFGKNPSRAEGYARETVKNYSYRSDQFYRWVWDEEERYTTDITHVHGDGGCGS